jgi:hypothetical protein
LRYDILILLVIGGRRSALSIAIVVHHTNAIISNGWVNGSAELLLGVGARIHTYLRIILLLILIL